MTVTTLTTVFVLSVSAANFDELTIRSSLQPGGTSAVGAFTLSSVYGQPSALGPAQAGVARVDPGFLCVEADDLPIPGDLNGDGSVNGVDLAALLGTWGPCGGGGDCIGDIDLDGLVGGTDLAIMLGNWG
jgi:hypothetical protein